MQKRVKRKREEEKHGVTKLVGFVDTSFIMKLSYAHIFLGKQEISEARN